MDTLNVLTTEGLTKLIQNIKSTFIKTTDTINAVTVDIDTTITSASNNLVTGGAVYDAFSNKIVNQTEASVEIAPNVMNLWGEVSSLTITLATPVDANRTNEYMLQFTSPSASATTFAYPNTITWAESSATHEVESVILPNIEAGKTYQVSIVNNKGIIGGF